MLETPNLGYLFYYKYFRNENLKPLPWKELEIKSKGSEFQKKEVTKLFQDKNDTLTRPVLDGYDSLVLAEVLSGETDALQIFHLKTTYPGLLIGSGYTHETGLLNEFKLGFFFDHTSGLPVVPGSSVKGALRSPFINAPGYVLEIWQDIRREVLKKAPSEDLENTEKAWPNMNLSQIEELEQEIFGARAKQERTEGGKKGKDIFYDAIPVLFPDEKGKKLLANDFITPHINRGNRELDAFTDPTPLQFLKVLPDVTFCFQFELSDGMLKKGQKLELFRQIILNLGVGAKTNVGYGQFKN